MACTAMDPVAAVACIRTEAAVEENIRKALSASFMYLNIVYKID